MKKDEKLIEARLKLKYISRNKYDFLNAILSATFKRYLSSHTHKRKMKCTFIPTNIHAWT